MAGSFITFEGLDGCGKSTQLSLAAAHLLDHGVDLLVTHEPGGTELGERLRAAFLDPERDRMDGTVEALVVFASRRQHVLEVIGPALAAGRHVLCDRFTDSTRAYQGFGRGLPSDSLEALDRLATDGLDPDLTLLFDIDPELARSRGQGVERRVAGEADRLDQEALDFYRRVREGYLEIAAGSPERFRVIDASGSIEEIRVQVERHLDAFFGVGA